MMCLICNHIENRDEALFCCQCGRPLLRHEDPYTIAVANQARFMYEAQTLLAKRPAAGDGLRNLLHREIPPTTPPRWHERLLNWLRG